MTVALLRTSTNNAPTVVNAIPNQSAMVGTVFNYTVPDDTFTDADSDTLTYAATLNGGNELPSWLSFTAATRAFSGTPTAAQTVSVQVTASDGNGGSVSDFFDIVVSADTTTSVSGALVSNLNQSATSGGHSGGIGTGHYFQDGGTDDLAQGFTTGTNATGYTLTSIEIPFAEDISAADIADLTVSLHADDGSGNNPAATALFALDNPASIAGNTGFEGSIPTDRVAATHEFTVPAANTTTTFTMSTDYYVVLTYDQDVGIWYVRGDSWDSGAAPGWTIATRSRYKRGSGSWTANPVGVPLMIRVNGTTAGGTNAAPTVANPIDDQTATVGAAFNYTVPANTFADTDAGDTLTYTATQSDDSGLPSWLSFDAATRTFSGTPATANVGTLGVKVTASDGTLSVSDTFDIVVSAGTTTATCTGMCLVSNLNQLATSSAVSFGSTVTRNLVAQGFTTGASTGGYTLTSIEVAFNAAQTATQLGNLTAGVWSDDGSGNPSAELFTLTKPASIVAATNSGGPITLSVTGNYTVFTAPANTTLNPSTSYHMVLEGGSSKLWSTAIDGETGATGWTIADVGHEKQTAPTPGNWAAASDDYAASNAMLIRVNGTVASGTNAAPTVVNPIDDQTAMAGTAFNYEFPADTFADTDAGDTLTYTATKSDDTALPLWLSFAAATRTFSGTPQAADVETLSVKVTASDGTDSVSDTFDIVVSAAPVCAAPDFGTRRNIWTSTVDVEAISVLGSVVSYGFDSGTGAGSLADNTFEIGSNDYTVGGIADVVTDIFQFTLTSSLTSTEVAALKLHVCETGYDFADATHTSSTHLYEFAVDLDWSMETTRTVYLSLPANRPATGDLEITGTAQVGQELTADVTAVADADGIVTSTAIYQWFRIDAGTETAIPGARGNLLNKYTLRDDDAGKQLRVELTFTDQLGGEETLTSAAFPSGATVTANPAITIAADRPTATGKIDWIHYTLRREGDPAAELTVTVTFAGPADNDWSLDPTGKPQPGGHLRGRQRDGGAEHSTVGSGFGNIGFSDSATTSGALTARLGAKTGYDTSDTDEVQVVVTSGPAWVIKLADDAYRFDEDGGDQDIEVVATAASADMPAPSLDSSDSSVLRSPSFPEAGTARSPGDFAGPSQQPLVSRPRRAAPTPTPATCRSAGRT